MEISNGLQVINLQMRDYIKIIEECIQIGRPCLCENIHDDLPQSLDSILTKSMITIHKHDSQSKTKFDEKQINYNPSFRFYLSTRLSNPRYKPDVYSKMAIINFAIKEQGLEEQLLGKSIVCFAFLTTKKTNKKQNEYVYIALAILVQLLFYRRLLNVFELYCLCLYRYCRAKRKARIRKRQR
jgi:hypothetical protein